MEATRKHTKPVKEETVNRERCLEILLLPDQFRASEV